MNIKWRLTLFPVDDHEVDLVLYGKQHEHGLLARLGAHVRCVHAQQEVALLETLPLRRAPGLHRRYEDTNRVTSRQAYPYATLLTE